MAKESNLERQPNNPLHGVKLVEILEFLQTKLGWEEMGQQLHIKCFLNNAYTNLYTFDIYIWEPAVKVNKNI